MPEVRREAIASATLIASPGCYPTSILLPTIPLLEAGLIEPEQIIADSLSGVSGAGRNASLPFLYVECNESLRPYGVPKHRHLSEIEQELSLANGSPVTVQFTPHLVPVNRGILTTLYLAPALGKAEDFMQWTDAVAGCLAKRYAGVEYDKGAIKAARENATQFGGDNGEFIEGRTEDLLPELLAKFDAGKTSVILDPPRKGCAPVAMEQLREVKPAQVIYISCHPATLARDLNILCADGVYRLEQVIPIDMFPHTQHVECITDLRLNTPCDPESHDLQN